jgi:hypothetical protein
MDKGTPPSGELGIVMHSDTTEPVVEHGAEPDAAPDSAAARETKAKRPRRRAHGRFGAYLMTVVGLLLLAGGAALAAAPWAPWQIADVLGKVASRLETMGIHAGALAVGGMGLLSVAWVGRSVARLAAQPAEPEPVLVGSMRKLVQHVAGLTGSVQHLEQEVRELALREPIINIDAPPPDADLIQLYRDQKDAVFRLAASLDQLGKKISERLGRDISGLEHHFEVLRAELQTTRSTLNGDLERHFAESLTGGHAGSAAPSEAALRRAHAPNGQVPAPGPLAPVVLEEVPHPQLETEVSPLAFLEGLKSLGPSSQDPFSPSVEPPPLDFDQLNALPAPLPSEVPSNGYTAGADGHARPR